MGSRGLFAGAYSEGAIVSNRSASANLINQDTALTNHNLFPQQLAVLRSFPKSKPLSCRFCRELDHTIKSCYELHTNGEGILQDDDVSKKIKYSIVYRFPHKPSVEYTLYAVVLRKLPIREFCCQLEVSTGTQAKDYLMDQKIDPVEEGQSHYFLEQSEQVSTPKNTGKRKRSSKTKTTLEERLTHQELLYNNNEQGDSGIMYITVTVRELMSEIV